MRNVSFTFLRFERDHSSVCFHSFFYQRQPHAATFNLVTSLYGFKDMKNLLLVLGCNARTIVRNRKLYETAIFPCGKRNSSVDSVVMLNGVVDQVTQHLL